MKVTLISDSGELKVEREVAERMLRIQRNMRGRAYKLHEKFELVDGTIRKADQRTDRGEAEQKTTGSSDTTRE